MSEEKKSAIEKALERMPSYKQLRDIDVEHGGFIDSIHTLVAVEGAYEELQASGREVSEPLKERRYQILEGLLSTLESEVESLSSIVKDREHPVEDINVTALKRSAELAVEYIKKVDPNYVPEKPCLP